MRILACAIGFFLFLSLPCAAQELLVTLEGDQQTIPWALGRVQRVTHGTLLYDALLFRRSGRRNYHLVNVPVRTALDTILAGEEVRLEMSGVNIFITAAGAPSRRPHSNSDSADAAPAACALDEVVVQQPYEETTWGRTAATVYTLRASEIALSPVNNFLDAMDGRMPGASQRRYNGVAGSAIEIQLGGRNSLQEGNNPLIVVDGVPWATNPFLGIVGSGSAQGQNGASAFNGIPLSAIASLSIMKDAAATALYGSRASNGVILVTLKKGRAGALTWDVGVNTGAGHVVRTSPLLTTSPFLQLRQEAIQNDGLPVNAATLPERFVWDPRRYTDFKALTTGHTGLIQDAHADATWGNTDAWFLLAGRYHSEASALPGVTDDKHASLYGNLHFQSRNKLWRGGVSGFYDREDIRLPVEDLSKYQYLAPNTPAFTNAAGAPQWGDAAMPYVDIPALENNTYRGKITTLFGNGQVAWEFLSHFFLELHGGYNGINAREQSLLSAAGQTPLLPKPPVNDTTTVNNDYRGGIAESLVKYQGSFGRDHLDALAGLTYQGQRTGYSSRQEIPVRGGGMTPGSTTSGAMNRYKAFFVRATYVLQDVYILSGSLRRDASTKFGAGYLYGNFGSVSAAWIFRTPQAAASSRWLSSGKVKASYGTTGNDQINPGIYDTTTVKAVKNNLRWEQNYRAEAGVDVGFLQNKLFFSATAYRSWTSNQLIYFPRNGVTRSPAYFSSEKADVVNEGLEMHVWTQRLRIHRFHWSSELALTVPVNFLRSFPGLGSSPLANLMVVGKSLSVRKGYHLTGVDPQSGLYTFQQTDPAQGGGLASVPNPSLDPRWYAGWNNTVEYGRWELHVFVVWRRQNGASPLAALDKQNLPGMRQGGQQSNGPVEWLDHWRQPGDHSSRQRLTSGADSAAVAAAALYTQSDGAVTGASFLRVKTVALFYHWVPADAKKGGWIESMALSLRGENLLTVTRFPVADPETQDPMVLPPLRVVTAGFSITFKNKAGQRPAARPLDQ